MVKSCTWIGSIHGLIDDWKWEILRDSERPQSGWHGYPIDDALYALTDPCPIIVVEDIECSGY